MMIDLRLGDSFDLARDLETGSIQTIVTSPPYWSLRDYGVTGQLGLERTPEEYVCKLVELFRELRRALKDDGTLWLNLGDSFAGGKGQSGSRGAEFQERRNGRGDSLNRGYQTLGGMKQTKPTDDRAMLRASGIKPKDLVGIPWRVAFALQSDGWYLRSDIIWHKPNPMPESVTDRPTKSHEYIFLLSKNAKYYYDADAVREKTGRESTPEEYEKALSQNKNIGDWYMRQSGYKGATNGNKSNTNKPSLVPPNGRNRRSVWTGKEGRLRLRRDLSPEQVSLVLRRIADGGFPLSSDTDSSSIAHGGDPQ